ncbi:preprotein translocase subunit SecG, partial [Faecalibacillus faecis]|nr:preprotein translocase subunit SecG [Faecalibacillus faecis]
MKTALTILFLISCVVLIILVLMQEGKEAGLGSLT